MCLGVPGQVVSIDGFTAVLDVWGRQIPVRIDTIPEQVKVGDFILEHAGYAERLITPDLVADTLAQYEIILTEAGCDPIAIDIVAELA